MNATERCPSISSGVQPRIWVTASSTFTMKPASFLLILAKRGVAGSWWRSTGRSEGSTGTTTARITPWVSRTSKPQYISGVSGSLTMCKRLRALPVESTWSQAASSRARSLATTRSMPVCGRSTGLRWSGTESGTSTTVPSAAEAITGASG
jgi:hypothetical protein